MGQRISSSRLTSLVSPNQNSPCSHHNSHCRRYSLGSLEGSSFRSLSCLNGPSAEHKPRYYTKKSECHVSRRIQRSKSQDREPSNSNMSSLPFCSYQTCCECRNSAIASKQLLEDIQNGNSVDVSSNTNTCVKSSSIERYMSALTERMGQTLLSNSECKCYVQPSTSKSNNCVCASGSGAVHTRTKNKNKLVTSKSCSKQLDHCAATQDCFSCVKDGGKDRIGSGKTSIKKKRWMSKFYGSKLTKNGGKVSVNDAAGGSPDSGLDIAGSVGDSSCVCTLYRKMDDSSNRVTQSNSDIALSSNNSGTSITRNVCVRSNVRHECEVGWCGAGRSSNSDLTTLSLTNLPINITLSHVGQPVYSALLTTASSNNTNVYGTLTRNGSANIYGALVAEDGNSILLSVSTQNTPIIDLRLSAEEYPVEDSEERARVRRAWEIAEGVDPPPGYRPHPHIQVLSNNELRTLFLQRQSRIHTQVDFIHCLVPDLKAINQCSFYWGTMDRYEAERLLEGKPEGTFLLRDSAQEDYLFSVSFRKYGRSLHARIEQFNHKFSFDSHDPGVYAANTVTGLIEHYKDPACVMFFEPMLTAPLSRTFAFPLQHLCRAVIASCTTYDGINDLRLPQTMKAYLKEYHYRQRVRVKRFEGPPEGFNWAPEEAL